MVVGVGGSGQVDRWVQIFVIFQDCGHERHTRSRVAQQLSIVRKVSKSCRTKQWRLEILGV